MRSLLTIYSLKTPHLLTCALSASSTTAARCYWNDSTLIDAETTSTSNKATDHWRGSSVLFGTFGLGDGSSSIFGVPQLCATPKKKLTLYRRGNRRVWYWLKRKQECAKCSFCGALGGRNEMFSGAAGNPLCTGQCVEAPTEGAKYPPEYKPPC